MDNNNNDKTNSTGKNIAGLAAKGVGKAFGGKIGEKAIGVISKTKGGQRFLGSVGTKSNATTNNILASNSMSRMRHSKSSLNPLLGSSMMGTNTFNDMSSESISDDTSSNIDNIKGNGTGIWDKLPIKTKITLLGIGISICSVIIFLIILITPLMELGIIDISDIGSSTGSGNISGGTTTNDYTSIPSSTSYWWPVGGSATSNIGGVNFAKDPPSKITITSYFGIRKHPITGEIKKHSGMDIVGGSNIIAASDGEVIYPSNSDKVNCPTSNSLDDCGGGYGNYVMIRHGDGTVTLYAHLYENSITVRSGDTVKQGQVIAKMGSSGNSTGTHLHFEVRVNNTRVEPLNYVSVNNPRP